MAFHLANINNKTVNNWSITSDLGTIPSVTSIQLNIVNKLIKTIGSFPSKNQT